MATTRRAPRKRTSAAIIAVRETPTQKAARMEQELVDLKDGVAYLWREYNENWCDDGKRELADELRSLGIDVKMPVESTRFEISFSMEAPENHGIDRMDTNYDASEAMRQAVEDLTFEHDGHDYRVESGSVQITSY